MRIGPFISLISSTFGVPEATVTVVARALREAGWLTSGARGTNAPQMTAQDAARLSLALLTGEPPGRVVEEFEFIRGLKPNDVYPADGLISQDWLPENHNLEDALVALFEFCSDAERLERHSAQVYIFRVGPFFKFSVDASRRTGAIELPGFTTEYLDLAGQAEIDDLYEIRPQTLEIFDRICELEGRSIPSDSGSGVAAGRGMRVVRTITQDEFMAISAGLFDLKPD